MAKLRRLPSGEDIPVLPRCILGRSRACTLRFTEPSVSGEHASLRWASGAWELQDLDSRNGTFVDRRRLARGERAALTRGSVLGLGRPDGLVLVDANPPEAFATPLGSGPPIMSEGGLLALPDAAAPLLMIVRDPAGWMVERTDESRVVAVADGELVRIGADAWQLHLPEPLPLTEDNQEARPPDLDGITLRFHVSRDEEYVELFVAHGAGTIDMKARSHHYTLLLLARARLREHGQPDAAQGWVLQSDLLQMLHIDANRLHLDIYRLRRQFAEAGIAHAVGLVERRAGTRALRIGVKHIEIHALDSHARDRRAD
jgi:hypothetical protein